MTSGLTEEQGLPITIFRSGFLDWVFWTPAWTRSNKRTRKRRPFPKQDRSTDSASRGHTRGVVWVATLQGWGGAGRWCTIVTTTNLHYQRAQPSPLWSRLCPGIRIGRGLARIPGVLCGKAP